MDIFSKMLYSNITRKLSSNQDDRPLKIPRLFRDRRLSEILEILAQRGLKPKEQLKVLRDLRGFEIEEVAV